MATQFQNAFSDNALKNLVILLILAHPMSEGERNTRVALTGALFAAPFVLFSMLGGWLADRFPKRSVMLCVKATEIGIMLLATIGLGCRNLPVQLIAVFLMGCHSAIFGPSKYSILPEILPLEKLSWGNGILELLTFLGIILGTVAGGFLAGYCKDRPFGGGILLATIAVFGWALCRGIPRGIPANPECPMRINPITDLWRQLRLMKGDRDLWRANLGNAAFFFLAALVQMNLVLYGQGVLHLNESQNGMLNASLAIGIGVGSVAAGYASKGRINYKLVPIGALLMWGATIPMGLENVSSRIFYGCLILLGLGGGLFIVPITAVLQHRPAPANKGAVQGAASVLSFVGILIASGVQVILSKAAHLGAAHVFWVCGSVALLTGIYVASSRNSTASEG
jgi:MFS family permease